MGRLKDVVRRITRVPGVPEARHVTERVVAPYLRADLQGIHADQIGMSSRIDALHGRLDTFSSRLDDMDQHMPLVLNAIASTNGTARLLRRELEHLEHREEQTAERLDAAERASGELHESLASTAAELRVGIVDNGNRAEWAAKSADEAHRSVAELYEHLGGVRTLVAEGDANVLKEMTPHIDTIAWLLRRIEMVRAEMMNEIRYGRGGGGPSDATRPAAQIVNPAALEPADGVIRVNLGAGHLPIDGYVNVDMREIPGIDVIAAVDDLPFEPGSLAEITSAHTLEHFPLEELRRRLLPYWIGLLRPGGTMRATVPDMEAMARGFADGSIGYEAFRSTTYGGQEYEGDFHFNGFTPTSLAALFEEVGLTDCAVVERGRPNGDCLECEVTGQRPIDS